MILLPGLRFMKPGSEVKEGRVEIQGGWAVMLTVTVFLPVLGALALYLVPKPGLWRWIAVSTAGLVLVVSIVLAVLFNWHSGTLQFEQRAAWIPQLGASYHLGVDGLSLPLVLLTALLTFLALFYAWKQQRYPREYFALYLVMETGLLGFFSTMDLLLFYVFFEIALVPMYFIIGIWGHEQRIAAALKFFLYTRVSGLAVLLSILALYLGTTPHTFDLPAIIAARPFVGTGVRASLVLPGFLIGFGIKLPVFPLHAWLPDAHTEAPTEGSVILAGLLLKLGGYGFLRVVLPTVPDAFSSWAIPIAALAVFSAIYGAAVAMAQADLKRLIAFSSINHMGYVLLGVAVAATASASAADRAAAATGAAYQLLAHGLITGALFFLVGMLADRTGTREIRRLSGIWAVLPLYGSILAFAMLGSLGLPPLASFAAEVQIVLGTLGVYRWAAVGMLFAILITTAMFLWTLQRVLLDKPPAAWAKLSRLTKREVFTLAPLVTLILLLGILPGPLVNIINGALHNGPAAILLRGW
jgi:NADH-quinone oxidoreductase subunit M